jgi:aminomuconate-semialdehyde/2-hydroxymuconate-6-semialdehyde dehydrogenase
VTVEPAARKASDGRAAGAVEDLGNYIDGSFRQPRNGRFLDDLNPATGEVIARLPDSDAADVAAAVEAAQRAFPGFAATTAQERSRLLLDVARGIEERAEHLAMLEARDTGKPLALARRLDIPRAIANFRFFAGAALHAASECHPTDSAALNYTLRRPLGVVALISPWNLPIYLLTWKVAPALATGNTCVAKPSELTPLTAGALAEICHDAGVPPGVFNLVHGLGPRAGAALTVHPDVRAISFTGGTATGAAIMGAAGPLFKKVSLELGGKNPNVLFDDADLETALDVSVQSAFMNQGQICLSGSRVFAERRIYDQVVEGLVARATRLKIGDPLDPATEFGSLISRDHAAKVSGYLTLAGAEGGKIECGGARPSGLASHLAGGAFLDPAVVTGLAPASRVMQEEIFGPVVTVTPFADEEEAIALANGTRFGLSATVWTNDLRRAHRVAARLEAGTVWVNTWLLRDLRVPFGGTKMSGIGREGGRDSLEFFTEPQNICIKL